MTPVPAEAGKNTKNVTVDRGPFEVPGFLAGAVESGMRYTGRLDLALICAQDRLEGCAASGIFTKNLFCAAPVELCRHRLQKRRAGAILANAGIANACTGEEGKNRALEMALIASEALGCPADSVLVSSTGVIGMQIDLDPVARSMPALVRSLRPNGWQDAAKAIMTTDTVEKMASARIQLGPHTITVGGIAKGAGMIAPDMATLLVFVCTDASVSTDVLDLWTAAAADGSFNCITVDGDTSTNDSLIVLAAGTAANSPITDFNSPESRAFGHALTSVLRDLAQQVVMDAEGGTKLIQIEVRGAVNRADAKQVAFTIANSPLVKTAFFGEDPNWGRIVAAAGRSGAAMIAERVGLFFEDLCVFENGAPACGEEVERKARCIFGQKEIRVRLELGMGEASFTAWTCDLSFDYVKINASYRS